MAAAAEAQPARRIALLLEYDGSRFAGSQWQSEKRTVQSVLEDAVERTTQERTRVAFAGRTDAGVHARGQVASFDTNSRLDAHTLTRALNAWLPEDVSVRDTVEVPGDFDVRRDAKARRYRYLIANQDHRGALDRLRAWHVPGELDVAAMAAAARCLEGRHDFAAFASRLEKPEASTVREIFRFEVRTLNAKVSLDVEGNAFLPHQVRRMTGALVEVGRGRTTWSQYRGLLEGAPASAGPAAPPHGLYLMQVVYERPLFAEVMESDKRPC